MEKEFPVYDICKLSPDPANTETEVVADHLCHYLDLHYAGLHFPHRHSFYQLVFFTAGRGSHTIDFEKFPIRISQLYVMVPGQVHTWNFEKDVDGYIVNFSSDLFGSFLANPDYLEQFTFLDGNARNSVLQVPLKLRPAVEQLLELIVDIQERKPNHGADKIRSLLLYLLLVIQDHLAPPTTDPILPQKQLVLRNFQKMVEANYRTLKLPKEYADLLYITPNHLNALCQDLLGKTAGELIRDRVLLEAKRLLTNAAITAAEVGYQLNFKDNSYFNRFFKKYTGQTPDDFRHQFLAK